MPVYKLTDAYLRAISPKRGRGTVCISDQLTPGLQVRIGARGRKDVSFVYRVLGDPKQYRTRFGWIWDPADGPTPDYRWITLDHARTRAAEIRERAGKGNDLDTWVAPRKLNPKPETPAVAADSVDAILTRYAGERLKSVRTGTALERLLRQTCSGFLDRPIGEVTRGDIRTILDGHMKRDHGYQANRVHAVLGGFFKWALDRELVLANPLAGMARPMRTEEERDRVLTDAEFGAIWAASEKLLPARRDALRLLMLTGARYDEVASLPWSELDLAKGEWLLPKERAKTKSERLIFLTPLAIEIIQARLAVTKRSDVQPECNGLVFDRGRNSDLGLGKSAFPALIKQLGIADARLHDVRRTVATGLQRLGIPEHVIDRCCGWSAMKGAKRRYQRHEYLPERRAAMLLWSEHVAKISETIPCAAD